MGRLIKSQPRPSIDSGFICPSHIWHDRSISLEEKAVLIELERLGYAGVKTIDIQQFFGFSKQKTKKILKGLEFKGWLSLDGEDA